MTTIARLSVIAVDCPAPDELAEFYRALTGWPVDAAASDAQWVQLGPAGPVTLAFQRSPGYRPPEWPGDEHPQQLHLDFAVADLDEGERRVCALGATKARVQPGSTFRVFLDPVGHPFCLVLDRHAPGS